MNVKGKKILARWLEGLGVGLVASALVGVSNIVSFGAINALYFGVVGFILLAISGWLSD